MSPLSIRALALLLTITTLPAFAEANRIVSLSAQVTETLFAPGVGDGVVAIDSSSLWPPQAQTLPNAGLMIELAGGQNVGQDFEGYKPLSAESLVQLAPEVIVVPQHVLPQLGGLKGLRRKPAIAATQLARAIHQTPLHGD
ncbi:hypothetical protein RM530_13015 [Algiphilus sp. W345]|uniref:Fe/B12 periplasmic-binding domain-containing protein n=1 Tax=Banduia mediterranea TaxID=3075609 RepID=A0ABU2WK89_9GAMM|nr:hypothetical protein [Algiphilus sp. W345]MDT0498277.1 hypothetical protein [Algiphilus sp. W345]